MKFNLLRRMALPVAAALCVAGSPVAFAEGWPANYEGVMLQGFFWDSYSDTKWSNLKAQADELSSNFSLIWIPNSGSCGGGNNMGYMPQYWFTNHNSSFGTEAELLDMIATFKAKGTGMIADVVINHRNGVTNWTDFPTETWNGTTWHIGPDGICSTDEVRNAAGQAKPTGAADTGDDFDGARDLDHTNANVQNNCKNYALCLLQKYGYEGFRYDMVKGYAPQYTKIYNQYASPRFSVGEYWDASYDAVAAWIEGTGRESAAFDFPGKYAINEAFASGDMTKLVWKANGTTPQPAGMIHYGYPRYAVTFVENHDTYRDGSRFTGNVVAANAFILCSPGTPCVFLRHWLDHKSELSRLIAVRNAVGVNNMSAVKVLRSAADCYMAEVTGTRGRLVVKVGSAYTSPDGYTDSQIKASGTDYCVWATTDVPTIPGGGDTPVDPVPAEEGLRVFFDNSASGWEEVYVHYWGAEESTWPGIAMERGIDNVWSAVIPEGTTGVVFNNNNNGLQTNDVTNPADGHCYKGTTTKNFTDAGEYHLTNIEALYILGNLKEGSWMTDRGVRMERDGDEYVAQTVEFVAETASRAASDAPASCYFNITDRTADSWEALNAGSNRWGPAAEGTTLSADSPSKMMAYPKGVNAADCKSWTLPAGTYTITANPLRGSLTAREVTTAITYVLLPDEGTDGATEWWTLQGIRVAEPRQPGIYVRRTAAGASKVVIQ
ncbi:MAG: starch-binding protein [Bacteroides sp.]|nr:starch-binding protein [Bacteroides sp.]